MLKTRNFGNDQSTNNVTLTVVPSWLNPSEPLIITLNGQNLLFPFIIYIFPLGVEVPPIIISMNNVTISWYNVFPNGTEIIGMPFPLYYSCIIKLG